jgi:nucleotide-binding universal stress UspA family protein
MKILLAVDGSKHSMRALNCLIGHADWYRQKPQVELVTVHLPVPAVGSLAGGVNKSQVQRYYREEGEACLAPAKKKLDAAKMRYAAHVLVGPIAETLVKHAKDARCDLIYLGNQGRTATAGALFGSTATKVLHVSRIPVLLVK